MATGQTLRERITTLEAHDHELMGNGQPGRIEDLEDQIKKLRWAVVIYVVLQLVSQISGNDLFGGVTALVRMLAK